MAEPAVVLFFAVKTACYHRKENKSAPYAKPQRYAVAEKYHREYPRKNGFH